MPARFACRGQKFARMQAYCVFALLVALVGGEQSAMRPRLAFAYSQPWSSPRNVGTRRPETSRPRRLALGPVGARMSGDSAPSPSQPDGVSPAWYSNGGLKFSCTMCGHCCSGSKGSVKISAQEALQMAQKLGFQPVVSNGLECGQTNQGLDGFTNILCLQM